MVARFAPLGLLVLAWMLAMGACKKDDVALKTLDELTVLTDKIVNTVRQGADKSAAVAQAQTILDQHKDPLGASMKELMAMKGLEVSTELQSTVANRRASCLDKMTRLEIELLNETIKDETLEVAVESLMADYDAMVAGR